MKLYALIGLAFSVCFPMVAQAKMVADVDVADEMTVAEQTLVLNGAGVRSKFLWTYMLVAYICHRMPNSLMLYLSRPLP